MPRLSLLLVAPILLALPPSPLGAQDSLPQPVKSMGQPPRLKPYLGAFFGANALSGDVQPAGFGLAGVYKDLVPPLIGIGAVVEGYAGSLGDGFDGGARIGLAVPVFFTQASVDYAIGLDEVDFVLSLLLPVHRGGILGSGSGLRVDWIPGRSQTVNVGLTLPVFQGPMGKTRPRRVEADIAKGHRPEFPDSAATDAERLAALARMGGARDWMLAAFGTYYRDAGKTHELALAEQRARITFFRDTLARPDERHPEGRTFSNQLADWHLEMARAFGLALGAGSSAAPARARDVAASARDALLTHVLMPFDATFGRYSSPRDIFGLAAEAKRAFVAALPTDLAEDQRTRVIDTFDRIVILLDDWRKQRTRLVGDDPRLAWLPLQLALLPDEYDDQEEINAIIERVVGRPFRAGNDVAYTLGTEFQDVLERQIESARTYHVLWVHDFAGLDASGQPDSVAFRQTSAYLRALAKAVDRYERGEPLTRYYIFLDENYYDTRRSSIWMNILERPLSPIRLPRESDGMAASLTRLQDSLRGAIQRSTRLADGRARHGDRWVEKLVKVNVNITHPSDLSFRSSKLVVDAPFIPDNLARDHRKIAFMDITPGDPQAGTAILAGVGVGESYDDATWDDRALVVRGPATVAFMQELQRLMLRNGFRHDEIPEPFRNLPDTLPGVALDATLSGMLLASNDVGFGHKGASIAQMVLLTLLPPGSAIYIPDSIWTSMVYASELVVAALRGCHVILVTPARENAPANLGPTQARTWDVFSRMLEVQIGLGPTLDSLGGRLRVGLYHRKSRITDPRDLRREVGEGLIAQPFLLEEFKLTPDLIRRAVARHNEIEVPMGQLIHDTLSRAPRLHAKTQFFASGDAWRTLLTNESMMGLIMAEQRLTIGYGEELDEGGMPLMAREVMDSADAVYGRIPDSVQLRTALYFTAGSMNKDDRSMLLDGEVNMIVAGPKALVGVLEFLHIFGLSRWPTSQEELNELLPPWSERDRKRAYWLRKAL